MLRGVSRIECIDILLGATAKPYAAEEKEVLSEAKNARCQELLEGLDSSAILPRVADLLDA